MIHDRTLLPTTQRQRRTWAVWRVGAGLLAAVVLGVPAWAADGAAWPVLTAGPAAGWKLVVSDFESQAELSGERAVVPKPTQPRVPESQVSLARAGDPAHPGALSLRWQDAWYAALRVEGGPPADLRPFLAEGTLEFDLKVDEIARGGLFVAIGCGKDCHRKVNFVLPSRALAGRGWQHLAFPLTCFARVGDDFSAIPQPFILDGSGRGEVSVAQVRYQTRPTPGVALAPCVDYRTESVTPSPLNQVWALEWWMPRHEKKLQEIREARAAGRAIDLVFIGDSITQGWEDAGRAVWDEHFARYQALNLGFGGDHTENVLWRLQHGELDGLAPKVAVLMIGTNNTGDRQEEPRTTAAGIRRLVQELRQRLPQTRVLLLAIFPRDEQPTAGLRRLNDQVNGQISALADGEHVFFQNLNDALMNPDGSLSKDILPDLLHLSERGYRLWAEQLTPTLRRLLSSP